LEVSIKLTGDKSFEAGLVTAFASAKGANQQLESSEHGRERVETTSRKLHAVGGDGEGAGRRNPEIKRSFRPDSAGISNLQQAAVDIANNDYLVPTGLKLGLGRIGFHTFRHTYRAWLDETGAPVGVQQKLMRHAHVSTTMDQYGNASALAKRKANRPIVQRLLQRPANQEVSIQ